MNPSSEIIRKLQFSLEDLNRYKPMPFELPKPSELRLQSSQVKEVVFENNPYLVGEIEKLGEEKRLQDTELEQLKWRLKDREDEIARLRSLVDKLRSGLDNFKPGFGNDSLPEKKNMKEYYLSYRAGMIERAVDLENRRNGLLVKELMMTVLRLNKDYGRKAREVEGENRERLVTVLASEVRDPLFIWAKMRLRLVDWLYQIFVRSNDESSKLQK